MGEIFPTQNIARLGETLWNLSGLPMKRTDLPLTEGRQGNARRLDNHLRKWAFAHAFTNPLLNYAVWRDCAVIAALGLLFDAFPADARLIQA